MPITAGYDVGGAHLKVALAEDGRVVAVRQIACPLWQGLDTLDAAFAAAAPLVDHAEQHAATMTGELCELFPDRRTGVAAILERLAAILGPGLRVWMGRHGLGSVDEAHADPMSAASTNFLASAEIVAAHFAEAMLIDMGSTTTDIIPIVGGRPCPRGLTDGERLATGELVYTGLTRTDVCNVARSVIFRGHKQRLAAGGFATMADVRRILRELPDGLDQHDTADKRGKSLPESLARFARCLGRDRIDADLQDWREVAAAIEAKQMEEIRMAFALARGLTPVEIEGPIVAAGIGAQRIVTLMQHSGLPTRLFGDLIDAAPEVREWATRCAPAAAVALLSEKL